MIPAVPATVIVVSFIVVFGVVVPILNKRVPKYISYRWCVVVVVLALLVGVVIDFDALSDELRRIIAVGALIVSGGYILLRTVEKALANGWLRGVRLDVRKGDASATLTSSDNEAGTKTD